ncbi:MULTISPECIES: hypothetical protein [unclassified Pseudomonas]|uniref:hypothetical protein n=1 Tax=unclassified Pseudomonas TaxID=196821 RepID=UPI0011990153|nr:MULTISPECIES: hypothetical protein [unclassified Pseudomonas]TWC06657.1 hypothetical protein FBY00_15119 [Pseudomonas sp. SJZ075]TWC26639.1 hypothetical protein FBY02_15019 [Pseudomonas sp. SJZ078]TWC44046.1 hypothetical protein FBY04_1525 [Pseudomonas sp. SJZ080]TWC45355.1 hypothetical protein FBY11_1525 [Pseudomonas sp. SJZ124]TWC80435.1 hypothetical protein FBY09_1505 [Pseudomonas sp. SJZ101]
MHHISTVLLTLLFSYSTFAVAEPNDLLNIAGKYRCTGFDNQDGPYLGALDISLNEQASHFEKSFGAYQFKLSVEAGGGSVFYSGFAAAQG